MPKLVQLTPFQKHQTKWSNCQDCTLCETRRKVVLFRGSVPCDILFIGEAPGKSEDTLGKPFVGPAGQLLDRIIEQSGIKRECSLGFTNLISCIPIGEEGTKVAEPPKEAIEACHPRLEEIVNMCTPSIIVKVGQSSQKHPNYTGPLVVDLIHPAAILRMDLSQKGLAIKRSIVILSDAVLTKFGNVPF